jgi:F-type H+-transporting ATPase subunit delta
MSADLIVQKYSNSLFAAGEENKKTEQIASELSQITKIFAQSDVMSFFNSPFNANDNKVMVAKSALEGKCSPETFNFMITLVQNERVAFLEQINEAFQGLVRAKGGETEGTLAVAGEVSDQFKSQVEEKLSKQLNKKVKLTVQKDPSLLSGYKISVAGWVFDDSAQLHLNKIKEEILKRGI